MNTAKKSITFIAVMIAILVSSIVMAFSGGTAPKAEGTWECGNGMSSNGEVYIAQNSTNPQPTLNYNGDLSDINTVEGEFLYKNNYTDDGGAFMGFQVFYNSSQFYIIRMYLNLGQYYDSSKPFVRAQKMTNSGYVQVGNDSRRLDRADGFGKDTWIKFKVVLESDRLEVYLNDKSEIISTGIGEVSWSSVNFITSGEEVNIKNPAVSFTAPALWDIDANWTNKDGPDVYSTDSTGVIWYSGKDVAENNTIEADIKYDLPLRGDGGINLQINHTGTGGAYLLNLSPNNPFNPVIRLFNENSTNGSPIMRREIKSGFGTTDIGDWIHLKLVVDNGAIVCYVNDILAYRQFTELDIEITRIGINSFLCPVSVKNMSVSFTEVNFSELGYIDLEFSSSTAVDAMTVQKCAAVYSDGKMILTVADADPKIVTPVISEAPGHKYSMYLPLRNTFLVRMKNQTSASKVRLTFKTDTGKDRVYEKEFSIKPNSDFNTYYFNIDDLGADGYLKQFALEFVGALAEESVVIDAITFEREKRIYDYAGSITACTADPQAKTVTVTGKVKSEYEGKTVTIQQSDPKNYTDDLAYSGCVRLTTANVSGGAFSASFPLYKPGTERTHLSSLFLASVDGVKISEAFAIENYYDFNDDAPRFTVDNKLTAVVTDPEYGAKGDGFTDDTAAIQKAIDAVAAAGGGKVIIPGDDSEYGKRYVMTHIELCGNLEFEIQKNAVLWQSQREEELNKTVPVGLYNTENEKAKRFNKVTYGHNVDIDGLQWCHAFATVNIPFILVSNKENVRITGGGTIRMNDAGGEKEDPFYFVGDPGLAVGQESRVQQIPICIYSSTHVDIRDLTIMRSNGWHCYMSFNDDVYVANIREKEMVNVTCDGFTVTSCKNVTLDRCFTYTSDDAVGICTAYDDGRGQFYRPTKPGENNATENIKIRHCFLYGGFGISWMPWGTAAENAYYQETRNVEIFDCILGGHKSSGTWPDDPFYGWSSFSNYTQTEDNDYCAIKDVYFHDNIYLAPFDWTLNNIRLRAANMIVTDDISGTIRGSDKFLNGNFDKNVHGGTGYNDETNYVTGLCYWSNKGNVGVERMGDKQSLTVDTYGEITQPDYAGYINENGELFQGMYCTYGAYIFKIDTKTQSDNAELFVRDAVTGDVIATKSIAASDRFSVQELKFYITRGAVLQLGVSLDGGEEEKIYIDNAELAIDTEYDIYEVSGNAMDFGFESNNFKFTVLPSMSGVSVSNGKLTTDGNGEYKIMLDNSGALTEYEASVDIAVSTANEIDAGLYLFASDVKAAQDNIKAYNVQIESSANSDKFTVSIFDFDGAFVGSVAQSNEIQIDSNTVTLRVVVKNNTIFVFVGGTEPILSYEVKDGLSGNIGLRSQNTQSVFMNFKLKTAQYIGSVDRSELNDLLVWADKFSAAGYTDSSFAKLTQAITEARTLPDTAKQSEIDAATAKLRSAINSLVATEAPDITRIDLTNTVAAYSALAAENYTVDSYAQFKAKLDAANALLNAQSATTEQLDTARTELIEAAEALEVKTVEIKTPEKTQEKTSEGNNGVTIVLGVLLGVVTIVAVVLAVFVIKSKKVKTKVKDENKETDNN